MPELSPGSTGRRWEPEGGVKKHNERIRRESKFIDEHKNLPFTFSKPQRPKKTRLVECSNCGYRTYAPKNTVGMICRECKKYAAVKGVGADG